jgi:hypothetical protein
MATDEAPTPELPLTGGCLCGGVRWEINALPISATYCHCTRCQRRSGTGSSAQVQAALGSFTIVEGEELVRSFQPPDGMAKAFCSVCGSALFSHNPEHTRVAVRLGGFDGDPGIRPQLRGHVASAAVWEPVPDDGLPRYDGSPWA